LNRDQKFFDMYSLVIGGLVAIAVAIFVVAMKISDLTQGVYTQETGEYQAAVNERIKPLSDVYLPGEEQAAPGPKLAPAPQPEPVQTTMTGPQVYNAACNVCHGAGIGGAPVVGNASAWSERIAQGTDMLYQHAIGGFSGTAGVMPPKGGNVGLSDQEVRDAVDFMITESQ